MGVYISPKTVKKSDIYGLFYEFCTYNILYMDAKLTLKLNREVIEKAKKYASDQKLSLSRLVETYLQSLTTQKESGEEFQISAFVKSISSGTRIPADLDYKEEYSRYLIEKYR